MKPRRRPTRLSISVSKGAYPPIVEHCKAEGIAVSAFVEDVVNASLDQLEATVTATTPGAPAPCSVCGELGHTWRRHERPVTTDRAAYIPPDDADPRPLKHYLNDAIKRNRIPSLEEEDSVPVQHVIEERKPGELLHRVAQRVGARAIDRDEALRKLATKPWVATARYLGVARGYHLFGYRDQPQP